MSLSDRNKKRRSFRFEKLEAKTSPTTFVGVDWIDSTPTAEIASADIKDQSERFLQYVATLEEISIERTLPTQAEANVVDQWLSTHSPNEI